MSHIVHRRIGLLGMSGTGKTTLARKLPLDDWFHYSADFRIGSHYLKDAITDNLRDQALQLPELGKLLRTGSATIKPKITIDDLSAMSQFLGKLGNPERGGMALPEFQRRQQLHHEAEVQALLDVPYFIERSEREGCQHFLADIGGSVCELTDPRAVECLAAHCELLYIRADADYEQTLIQRAIAQPKPLYYSREFLSEQLDIYRQTHALDYIALIEPDDFVRWVFPKLFAARIPKYDALCTQYAAQISVDELAQVRDAADFLELADLAAGR